MYKKSGCGREEQKEKNIPRCGGGCACMLEYVAVYHGTHDCNSPAACEYVRLLVSVDCVLHTDLRI